MRNPCRTLPIAMLLALGGTAAGAEAQPWARADVQDSALPLVVTEVMFDPTAANDPAGEWFEVYNPTSETYHLGGMTVTDAAASASNTFTIIGTLDIAPGEYLVFAYQADLGKAEYGVTADYVWTTGGGRFALANSRDTLYFRSGSSQVLEFVYNDSTYGGAWPSASGRSAQLDPTLNGSQRYMLNGTAWCGSTTDMAAGLDKGTPGAANADCPSIDADGDHAWAADDCDDEDPTSNVFAVEIPTNGVDNDCDGVILYPVIEDSATDSLYSTKNELTSFAVGWDEDNLVLGYDYTIEQNAIVWYVDLGVGGGENDFNSTRGYTGAFPSDVKLNTTVELMTGSYGAGPVYIYKVVNNGSTDITSQGYSARSSYEDDGSAGYASVRIPWSALYGLGPGTVSPGAQLQIVGIIRANDNQGPADIAPNNGGSVLNTYAVVDIDVDGDGLPDDGVFVDGDGDGFSPADGDCDDADPLVYPEAEEVCNNADDDCDGVVDDGVQSTFYVDADEDGVGDVTKPVPGCTAVSGTSATSGDCDDTDDANFPGNIESCDVQDNDCDTKTDEAAGPIWYPDADEDGYRASTGGVQACPGSEPAGSLEATAEVDCDDTRATVNPEGTERCNGLDDNCDGAIDGPDSADADTFYADGDADGFGDPAGEVLACSQPEGYVADDTDCDDTLAAAHPGLPELCADDFDNDCDGEVNEDSATDAQTWYTDSDEDGWGAGEGVTLCLQPGGTEAVSGDCDDEDSSVHPEAAESCDGDDEDCDGSTDEDPVDGQVYHPDADQDSYGADDVSVTACQPPPGAVVDGTDCDDSRDDIYPGADELPTDSEDKDCDGIIPVPPTPTPTATPATPTDLPTTDTPTTTPGTTETEPGTPGETPTAPGTTSGETPTPTAPTGTVTDTPSETATPTPTAETGTPTATAPETPTATASETSTQAPTEAPTAPGSATPTGSIEGSSCGGCDSADGTPGSAAGGALLLLALGALRRRARR